jgi:hypothetical protein
MHVDLKFDELLLRVCSKQVRDQKNRDLREINRNVATTFEPVMLTIFGASIRRLVVQELSTSFWFHIRLVFMDFYIQIRKKCYLYIK